MSNIVGQTLSLNRGKNAWLGAETLERYITNKLGKVNVLNIVYYGIKPKRIGKNQIALPKAFLKILYNQKQNYKRCFFFFNKKIDKMSRLKDFEVDCKTIKQGETICQCQ